MKAADCLKRLEEMEKYAEFKYIRLLLELQAKQIAELQAKAHGHWQAGNSRPALGLTDAATAELPLKEGT